MRVSFKLGELCFCILDLLLKFLAKQVGFFRVGQEANVILP